MGVKGLTRLTGSTGLMGSLALIAFWADGARIFLRIFGFRAEGLNPFGFGEVEEQF